MIAEFSSRNSVVILNIYEGIVKLRLVEVGEVVEVGGFFECCYKADTAEQLFDLIFLKAGNKCRLASGLLVSNSELSELVCAPRIDPSSLFQENPEESVDLEPLDHSVEESLREKNLSKLTCTL